MSPLARLSPELSYVGLLFCLFVVPRMLQRYRIPAAVSSLALGAAAGPGLGLFVGDATVALLATFGIVALFLFAGLDVELAEVRREASTLVQHLVLFAGSVLAVGVVLRYALDVAPRAAALLALALLTPSTGFILDSLHGLGLSAGHRFWVRTEAIATELVALGVLFVTLRSHTAAALSLSTAALVVMIAVLPWVFRAFAAVVVPHAPRSEFAFLMMVALVCALATRQLGVYYLVGAFVVGMAAQQFRERLPAMASEKMLDAVQAFGSIFIPFYFFHAGVELERGDFSLEALLAGAVALVVMVPLRLGLVALHRWVTLGELPRSAMQVGVPMLPTLVFTLVLTQILRERFELPPFAVGGLVIYALVNTAIPGLVLRAPLPSFEPELEPREEAPSGAD